MRKAIVFEKRLKWSFLSGITYEQLDKTITAIEKKQTKNISEDVLAKVKKMIRNSEHKRYKIPIFTKSS